MTRAGLARAGLALAVLVAVGAGATSSGVLDPAPAGATEDNATASAERATAEVARRTLTIEEALDGTLGYGGEVEVLNGLGGTLTALPEPGTVLARGNRMYEVDGRRRPILMYGSRPAWRDLGPDVSNGADVRQLEQNLKALGFARSGFKVDQKWTSATTAAVRRWQRSINVEDDGTIALGEIVFATGPIRVTERPVKLGQRVGPGQAILAGTTDRQVVSIDLAADRVDLAAVGDSVEVELPDGETVAGTVETIGTVAEQATDQFGVPTDPTVEITIAVELPDGSRAYEQAPVEVRIVRESRENVLAVPVNALVALLEGGYAVERVGDDGSSTLVGVDLGLFQDGWVEVRTDGVTAGDRVAVPS
jgi:peptidoglycan hydrolase-like protein with peptidoglycan-binding domain